MSNALRSAVVVAAAVAIDLLFWDGETRLASGGQLPIWLPVVATLAAHAVLWWRQSEPWAVFAAQLTFSMVCLLVPQWQPVAGLLVATYAVAAYASAGLARWGWLAALPLVTHAAVQWVWLDNDWVGLAQGAVLYLAAGSGAWITGRRSHSRTERLRAWQADQQRLRAEATLQERLELARELHDGVANTITAVLVQASAARAAADPAALIGIESAARRAMEEIQATLRLMPRESGRPVGPTLAELPSLLALAAEAGLQVEFSETGRRRALTPAVQTATYRAVQEGITNTIKYAPPGSRCRVSMNWTATELQVSIVDSPARQFGLAPRPAALSLPSTGGRGLTGLGSRLSTVGGVLESGSFDHGYRLAARLPVSAPEPPYRLADSLAAGAR